VAKINFGPLATARARRWIKDSDLDILHVHEPAGPTLSILSIWVADGPIVATWHANLASSRRDLNAMAPIVRSAMEKVRARIAVSEYARRSLVEYTGGDAVLIPNGVDCSAYAGDETLPGRARGSDTLMFLGRIDEPRKGLPTLLAALPRVVAAVPDVLVLVAGPGEVEEVRSGLDPDLAERVEFLGLVSEADKARALRSADIYVAPNTGGESFGIILLEAMAAGAPVVASDIGPSNGCSMRVGPVCTSATRTRLTLPIGSSSSWATRDAATSCVPPAGCEPPSSTGPRSPSRSCRCTRA
jgi:phosphatidylinositol alpha-mannosyltransferase